MIFGSIEGKHRDCQSKLEIITYSQLLRRNCNDSDYSENSCSFGWTFLPSFSANSKTWHVARSVR